MTNKQYKYVAKNGRIVDIDFPDYIPNKNKFFKKWYKIPYDIRFWYKNEKFGEKLAMGKGAIAKSIQVNGGHDLLFLMQYADTHDPDPKVRAIEESIFQRMKENLKGQNNA